MMIIVEEVREIDTVQTQHFLNPFELLLLRVLVRFNQQDLELDLLLVPLPLMRPVN